MRRTALSASCLPLTLPLGLWSPSYLFQGDSIVILPHMLDLPKVPTFLFLILTSMAVSVGAFTFIERVRVASLNAERWVQLPTWHLRQMVTEEAGTAVRG